MKYSWRYFSIKTVQSIYREIRYDSKSKIVALIKYRILNKKLEIRKMVKVFIFTKIVALIKHTISIIMPNAEAWRSMTSTDGFPMSCLYEKVLWQRHNKHTNLKPSLIRQKSQPQNLATKASSEKVGYTFCNYVNAQLGRII